MHKNTDRRTICIVILIMFSFFLSSAFAEETQENLFKIKPEKQISAPDMDCNYMHEDYWKAYYNFEYPKIVMVDNGKPIIAFVDEKSKNVFLTEVSDQDVTVLHNQSSYDEKYVEEWPIIFEKENKIYFVQLPLPSPEIGRKIKVYLFAREDKKLKLEKEKIFKRDIGNQLWGIYPFQNNFMLIAQCDYICLRYLPALLLLATPPTVYHNVSFLLNSNEETGKKLARQSIEDPGCYNVSNQLYDISKTGALQALWVRNTRTIGLNHDEIVYLSTNKDGARWSPSIELYSVKNANDIYSQLQNFSMTSYGESSFVLWQDREKGILFSEVNKDNKIKQEIISDFKKIGFFNEPMPAASITKIASDNDGNSYVLWIENIQNVNRVWDYKLHFKARMNGQWKREIIINKGSGVIKLPDMKVDKEGNVHITYIKSVGEVMQYRGEYACFYMKLERQSKKGQ